MMSDILFLFGLIGSFTLLLGYLLLCVREIGR